MATKNPQKKPGVHLLKRAVIHFKGKESYPRDEYHWHIVALNGRIIARSSETYTGKRGALNSIRVLHDVFRFEFSGDYFDHTGSKIEVKKTWR